MNLKIISLDSFKRDVKKLLKKYKKLPSDLKNLQEELLRNPRAGIELSNNCFKIRLANSSTPTGKSGGFRIISYYLDKNNNIYLLTIYSKTELENISHEKILSILSDFNLDENL